MTEQEKFDRAVAVLVKAYINNTLEHGSCTQCAVGNLVGALAYPGSHDGIGKAKGKFFIMPDGKPKITAWFMFMHSGLNTRLYFGKDEIDTAEEQRKALGYTWDQIIKIEAAFESTYRSDNAMYDGMMAVVDALSIIHNVNPVHTSKAQELFMPAKGVLCA